MTTVTKAKPKKVLNFKIYITKIAKTVHPDQSLTGEALIALNNIALYVIERVMYGANMLLSQQSKKTLGSVDIQDSVKLAIPGELGNHAVREGTKAVTAFFANKGTASSEEDRKAIKQRSSLAGLQFSVSRTENHMRKISMVERMGAGAPVYMAAVAEYIIAEITELAGNAARDNKRQKTKPRHIALAIYNDEELESFFRKVILGGGVQPNIHASLLPKQSKKKKSQPSTEEVEE